MPRPPRIAVIIATLLLISASSFAQTTDLEAGLRYRTYASGSADEPYQESPLGENVQEYAPLLELSNALVQQVINGDYGKMYDQHFSPRLKEEMSREWLVGRLSELTAFAGPARKYKPKQWRFSLRKHQGRRILLSTKIVEHQRTKIVYQLTVFPKDLKRIVGFQFTPLEGDTRPQLRAAFHSRDVAAPGIEHGQFPPPDEETAQAYAGLLKLANTILELRRKQDHAAVYERHFSALAKLLVSRGEYEGQAAQLTNLAGPIQRFDPAEWHLEIFEYLGREAAILTKTVEHEHGIVLHRFHVFPEDPTKLVGIQTIPRELRPRAPEYFFEKDGEMVPVD